MKFKKDDQIKCIDKYFKCGLGVDDRINSKEIPGTIYVNTPKGEEK